MYAITRAVFEQNAAIVPGTEFFMTPLDCWADEGGNLTGAVVADHADNDFGWVVMGRSQYGDFRAVELGVSLPTVDAARELLLAAMERHVRTKQTVWWQ
jgi:hypothetical protein